MTKIKTKMVIKFYVYAIFTLVMSTSLAIMIINIVTFINNPVPVNAKYDLVSIENRIDTKSEVSLPMKEWVLNEVESAGLNPDKADKIIQCESGWDNWNYGINTNGSTDFGLWQINSIHKNTASVECRFNYKCATYWAIQKRLNDGHWEAWVCN